MTLTKQLQITEFTLNIAHPKPPWPHPPIPYNFTLPLVRQLSKVSPPSTLPLVRQLSKVSPPSTLPLVRQLSKVGPHLYPSPSQTTIQGRPPPPSTLPLVRQVSGNFPAALATPWTPHTLGLCGLLQDHASSHSHTMDTIHSWTLWFTTGPCQQH